MRGTGRGTVGARVRAYAFMIALMKGKKNQFKKKCVYNSAMTYDVHFKMVQYSQQYDVILF
jgi:hypothetical protein